ncbi:hypothetical protein [Kaistia adipata]|uniref:hypothetical protein n=1 Tax=Kaistia adipata TaxID=166954 RepID=UPI00041CD135|nr:hypothetical protein [Kaistia adipata]
MKLQITKNLDALRADALLRLDQTANARIYDLAASPVAIVRARKAAEAEHWAAGGGAGPLLRAEAGTTGIDVASLVDAVLVKAANAAEAIATVEARRQAAQAAIRAATHPAAIAAALEEFAHG